MLEHVYKIKTDYVLQNKQTKNLYLLRADAQKGMSIHTSKKTIQPNDTALIVVEFTPEHTGKFQELIRLVTSADSQPYLLSLSGTITSIKADDKTACFYFNKPSAKNSKPVVMIGTAKPQVTSGKIPSPDRSHETKPVNFEIEPQYNPKPEQSLLLDEQLYKPNHIIFLVDVSSSMKDSAKLPVMQKALYYLIEALRPTDNITFITYADSVKLLKYHVSGNQKEELNTVVSQLKAKGLTKGHKAILYGLDIALKNYIPNGNNQLILATDGKFRFYSEDRQAFISKQMNTPVILSTIAFGNDKTALKNLKEIAEAGKGNFIHIKHKEKAKEQLLNEIKEHSLIRH